MRLRDGEQMDARVRMIARRIARSAEGRRDVLEPAEEKSARELRAQLRRPSAASIRNLCPMLCPREMRQRVACFVEKRRKRCACRQEVKRAQCGGDGFAAFARR